MKKGKVIDEMFSRFLNWKLPDDFRPDCGISFYRDSAKKNGWPVGTNLLTAAQAKEMVTYLFGGGDEKSTILVRCERWRECDDHFCRERLPHVVRREGHYSCRRRERCIEKGIVCRCINVNG